MYNETHFSELFAAKFCHDLAGPIGAINNGIDFLEYKDPEMRQKAIELVQFSSKQAVSKVKFLRKAYGFVDDSTEFNTISIESLLKDFLDGTNATISVTGIGKDICISSTLSKSILNMSTIVAGVILYKGDIRIYIHDDFSKIKITGFADAYKVEDDLLAILDKTSKAEMTTRNVQNFYTASLLEKCEYTIEVLQEQGTVTFSMIKK